MAESDPETPPLTPDAVPARLRELVMLVRGALGGSILWVKLTGLSTNLPALTAAAKDGGADAVVMMGCFMAMVPDLDTFAPALGTSGAYSGPWALPIVCRFLALSRRVVGPDYPLLGTNGVRSGYDIARMALAGAHAAEALSIVMLNGFSALTRTLTELDSFLTERHLCFADLVGRAADALGAYGAQPAASDRWQRFVPPETLALGSRDGTS